jgi:hypothetical protein
MGKRFLFFLFGFFLLCLAAPMCGLLIPYTATRDANRVERLTPVPASVLVDGEPGREVLVEGRVSSQNPARYDSFVAYVREEREVDTNDEGTPEPGNWKVVERVTPPLLLELADGLVQIENSSYNLQGGRTVERRSFWDQEIRYRGIEAGDHVIVVGTLFSTAERPQISAEFIYRGTQAQYISGQRSMAVIGLVGGIVSAVVGGILILWGLASRLFSLRPWPLIR